MKNKLIPTFAIVALSVALSPAALAKDKEVTLTGKGQCAKCQLHETKSCQNTITVEDQGKEVTYYLAQNKVSKDFHDAICQAPARITVTGTVQKDDGKMEITPTSIKLAK